MNTQLLEKEIENDLTGKGVQEREFYDFRCYWDGYLDALKKHNIISQMEYDKFYNKMHSYIWSDKQ